MEAVMGEEAMEVGWVEVAREVEAVEEGWVEVVMAKGVLEEAMGEGREAAERAVVAIQQLDGLRDGQNAHVLNLNCDAQQCYTIERILVGELASNTTNLHLRLWWPEKWTEAWRRSVNEAATKLQSESGVLEGSMSQEPRTLSSRPTDSGARARRVGQAARGWCRSPARRALFLIAARRNMIISHPN